MQTDAGDVTYLDFPFATSSTAGRWSAPIHHIDVAQAADEVE